MCCFFLFCHFLHKHCHPVPMPTTSVRLFRCTGMEATEMCHQWECRRKEEFCKWRDAQRKWVVEPYIKRSSLVLRVQTRSRSLWFQRQKDQKGQNRVSTIISKAFRTQHLDQLRENLGDGRAAFQFLKSSASLHPHICATVHHGDQHGHAACPFATFGDGGVPPVSGHSLRLQGRATRAPPPLRTVWHHRGGGGGGLLQSGGGPSPEVVLADRGEPEEEHQMSPFVIWARVRWIRLGCIQSGDQQTPSLSWMQTDEAVPDSKSWCMDLTEETIHD